MPLRPAQKSTQPPPLTRLDGYRAAGILIGQLMGKARDEAANATGPNSSELQSYFWGIQAAHALLALGAHPNHPRNAKQIRDTLRKHKKGTYRKP